MSTLQNNFYAVHALRRDVGNWDGTPTSRSSWLRKMSRLLRELADEDEPPLLVNLLDWQLPAGDTDTDGDELLELEHSNNNTREN